MANDKNYISILELPKIPNPKTAEDFAEYEIDAVLFDGKSSDFFLPKSEFANPMIFKGVLDANNSLPSEITPGFTYKVGANGTYSGISAKVGDLIVGCDGSHNNNIKHWALIPAGDDAAIIMNGATSSNNGASGLVPQPKAGDQGKFLRGDATWQTITIPSDTNQKIKANGVTFDANDTVEIKAGTGITVSAANTSNAENITISHANNVTAGTAKGDNNKTLTYGGTFTIPSITYDAQGHITSTGTTTMTMPNASTNTDTKVTQEHCTDEGNYVILASSNVGSSTTDKGDTTAIFNSKIYMNPYKGTIYSKGLVCEDSSASLKLSSKTNTASGNSSIAGAASIDIIGANATLNIFGNSSYNEDSPGYNDFAQVNCKSINFRSNDEYIFGYEGILKGISGSYDYDDEYSENYPGYPDVDISICRDLAFSVAGAHAMYKELKQLSSGSGSSSDTKVTQNHSTTNSNYAILASATAGTGTGSRGTTTAIVNSKVYMNPSTGTIFGNNLTASNILSANGVNTASINFRTVPDSESWDYDYQEYPIIGIYSDADISKEIINNTDGRSVALSINGARALYNKIIELMGPSTGTPDGTTPDGGGGGMYGDFDINGTLSVGSDLYISTTGASGAKIYSNNDGLHITHSDIDDGYGYDYYKNIITSGIKFRNDNEGSYSVYQSDILCGISGRYNYSTGDTGDSDYISPELTSNIAFSLSGARALANRISNLESRVSYLESYICLKKGTKILMGDGTTKNIEDVEYGDIVKGYDIENNQLINVKAYGSVKTGMANKWILHVFESGRILEIHQNHALYSKTKETMLHSSEWKYGEYGVNEDCLDDQLAMVVKTTDSEFTERYALFTENSTYIANGIVSGHEPRDRMKVYSIVPEAFKSITTDELQLFKDTAEVYTKANRIRLDNREYLKAVAPYFAILNRSKDTIEFKKKSLSKRDYKTIKHSQGQLSEEEFAKVVKSCGKTREEIAVLEVERDNALAEIERIKEEFGLTITATVKNKFDAAYAIDMEHVRNNGLN